MTFYEQGNKHLTYLSAYAITLFFLFKDNTSVNSTCAQGLNPGISIFFLCLGWGWRLLSCQITRGGEEKRGQMPRPPSTTQHFSLIAQSNSALTCDL